MPQLGGYYLPLGVEAMMLVTLLKYIGRALKMKSHLAPNVNGACQYSIEKAWSKARDISGLFHYMSQCVSFIFESVSVGFLMIFLK